MAGISRRHSRTPDGDRNNDRSPRVEGEPQPEGVEAVPGIPGPGREYEALLRLQRQIGNAATTRLIARRSGAHIQRWDFLMSDEELVRRAVESGDVGHIKAIPNRAYSRATEDERIGFISALVDQGWVGPMDEYALEAIWSSFGTRIARVGGQYIGLWKDSIEAGMDPSNVGALHEMQRQFERDVKDVARGYMRQNKAFAEEEMGRLGLRASQGVPSPTAETEQALHLEETQEMARAAAGLLDAKERMRQMLVGYDMVMSPHAGGLRTPVKFDPAKRPTFREPSWLQEESPTPEHSWEEVKEKWDLADAALAGVAAQSPTIYAAIAQGEGATQRIGNGNPQEAQAAAGEVLQTLHDNIVLTIPKLDDNDLDWRDLKPIHEQLYSGAARGGSGLDWSSEFGKTVGADIIGDHESAEFWIGLGLGTAAAALFIVANVATGGLATAALLGGLAVSAGTAVRSWENYEDLSTAAAATATEDTRLVSEGQVDAARLQAILDTVFAVLDIAGPVVRAGRAAMSTARLEAALLEHGAEAALTRLGTLEAAEAAQAVQRGIAELGVEGTMRKTGKSLDELAAMLRGKPGSEAALARLEEARRLGLTGAEEAAGAEGRALASTTGNAAEEAWKGSRPIGDLVSDVSRAVELGTITRQFANDVVAEAIERLGPTEVLRRSGGWKQLSQVLGAEASAGRKLMAWRDSVFSDLERFVRDELGGQVQRTGTATNFSNDIDLSFIGANAAEVRNGAAEYLARRLGVANSPREFDLMMMAGLFTDPRRMHIYDILPTAIRDGMARRQAAKEQTLIWNRRLWEATQAGDDVLARTIREQMGSAGVVEFRFRPLTSADVARLSRRIDALQAQLEKAVTRLDVAAQERLAGQIADSQALINAAEGGGYFSGGGVRRFVSERPGEAGFPRLGPEGAPIPSAERLTAILDQLPKLDHAALQLTGTAEDVAAGVRGIGKYGQRLAEVSVEAGIHQDSAWRSLVERCQQLKRSADFGETAARLTNAEADAVVREARGLFDELIGRSGDVLATVKASAGLPEIGNAASRIQYMTTAHVKLLRATDWAANHLDVMARTVRAITHAVGGPPEGEAEPAAAGAE